MRLLITGANGFVGLNLIRYLDRCNKLSAQSEDAFKNNHFRILAQVHTNRNYLKVKDIAEELIQGDLRDLALFSKFQNSKDNIDVLINLAGMIKGSKKIQTEVNITVTKNIVNFCQKRDVPLIHFSTIDVREKSNYGKTKLLAENIIKNSSLNWVILRPSVIYGRDDNKNITSLIEIIKKWNFAPMSSKGKFHRQPVYVEDVCELVKNILFINKYENHVFNVAGPEPISYNNIIKMIAKKLSINPFYINVPSCVFNFFSKDFTQDKIVDISKTVKEFSFSPRTFEDGLNFIKNKNPNRSRAAGYYTQKRNKF